MEPAFEGGGAEQPGSPGQHEGEMAIFNVGPWQCTMYHQPICLLTLHSLQILMTTYIPKRLPRQCLISIHIDVQLIRALVSAPLSRRHVRLAVIRRACRRTRVDDLNRNSISYSANRAPYTTSVRDGIASATLACRATRVCPACDWGLPVALRGINAAGACST